MIAAFNLILSNIKKNKNKPWSVSPINKELDQSIWWNIKHNEVKINRKLIEE